MLRDALGDLALSTDSLTQNRYSLAGGNPVSFIEYDGHMPIPEDGEDARKIGARMLDASVQMRRLNTPVGGLMKPYRHRSEVPFRPHEINIQDDGTDPLANAVGCGLTEAFFGAVDFGGDKSSAACKVGQFSMVLNPKGLGQRALKESGEAVASKVARSTDDAAKGGDDILFGQEGVRRTFTTAEEGSDFAFAGRRVADVASGLRNGSSSPDDVPIRYVVRDGRRIAINNRSLLAFRRAGVAPTRTVDVTGNPVVEARLSGRLAEMGGSPSSTIRVRGAGDRASYLDLLP